MDPQEYKTFIVSLSAGLTSVLYIAAVAIPLIIRFGFVISRIIKVSVRVIKPPKTKINRGDIIY